MHSNLYYRAYKVFFFLLLLLLRPSLRHTGKGLSALNERLPLWGWSSKNPVGYSGLPPAFFFTLPL